MKKQFLLILLISLTATLSSQVFVENFETATVNGNLEGYNGWYVSPKSGDNYGVSPKIEEYPLFYTNYPGSNIGHVAVLDSAIGAVSTTQRISTKRIVFTTGDTLKAGTSGALYYAAIVNINPVSYRSYRDFITWEGSETSSFTRGRVFAKNNTAGNEVVFAVSKNSSTAADLDAASSAAIGLTLSTGTNHLLVLKYQIVDGTSNDIITLFINPDPLKTEDEQLYKMSTFDTQTDYSATTAIKINLRQRGVGAQVGGIRVGRSWDAVVMGKTSGVNQPDANRHNIFVADNQIITGAIGLLRVFSISGAEVIKTQVTGKYSHNLSAGTYLVNFTDNQGVVSATKLLLR